MGKIIDKIVSSSAAPESKNVIWDNGKELKINRQGVWQSIGGSGGDPLTWETMTEEQRQEVIGSAVEAIREEQITTTSDTDDTNEYNDVF